MQRLVRLLMVSELAIVAGNADAQSKLPKCPGAYDAAKWTNCFGEVKRPSGIQFAAEFKDGKPTRGTATFPSGDKYIGEFKDGTQHGKGTMTWMNGLRYVGDWRDGEMDGQGTWTGPGGEKYVGTFRNNQWHGQGTYYRADGSIEKSGIWKNGEFVRSR